LSPEVSENPAALSATSRPFYWQEHPTAYIVKIKSSLVPLRWSRAPAQRKPHIFAISQIALIRVPVFGRR